MMAVDEQLAQLSGRLNKQSLGPIDTGFRETMSRLGAASAACVAWLRHAGYDRPLIALLLSCQAGYLVACLGRRYARR
jgi:hypothetical protein